MADSKSKDAAEKGNTPTTEQVDDASMVPASELPDPNPHAAGQTPAGETEQLDAQPSNDLGSALADAQRAMSDIHFNQSAPDNSTGSFDAAEKALNDALKAISEAKKR